jgi:iduronate 2-sulfatase
MRMIFQQVCIVCIGLFFFCTGSANARGTQRPDVLFLVADDLNNDLGCYGHPLVKSPNIDKLARRGVKFDHAYCQFPLCSPSRSSFLTGRRPNATQILSNAGRNPKGEYGQSPHFREFIRDTVTLPQLFRQNGYSVARVGKLYHYGVPGQIGTDGLDDPQSWDRVFNPRGRDVDDEEKIFTLRPDAAGPARFGGTLSWLAADGTDDEQTDAIGAAAAIKLLEENKSKPFFLAVGFFRPHTPYVAPKKYFDMYPLDKIVVPEAMDPRGRTPGLAYATAKPEEAKMTDQMRKQAIQAYYASTTFMDAQVGRVVDALDRLKLTDNTIIVFTSDHGYHMGEHGLWQKMTLFENSARVPLIIVPPKTKQKGKVSPRIVELIDVYPTLAELCGLAMPDYIDGASLKPLLENPKVPWTRPAFTQLQRGGVHGHSVRTEKWRYTRWDYGKGGSELYDHENDPTEQSSLAEDPKYAGVVLELKELIDRNWPKKEGAKSENAG